MTSAVQITCPIYLATLPYLNQEGEACRRRLQPVAGAGRPRLMLMQLPRFLRLRPIGLALRARHATG